MEEDPRQLPCNPEGNCPPSVGCCADPGEGRKPGDVSSAAHMPTADLTSVSSHLDPPGPAAQSLFVLAVSLSWNLLSNAKLCLWPWDLPHLHPSTLGQNTAGGDEGFSNTTQHKGKAGWRGSGITQHKGMAGGETGLG